MDEKKYIFRREDNEKLVEVSFGEMMEQQGGYITLPGGVQARRCVALEIERDGKSPTSAVPQSRPIVSDSLGFTDSQLSEMEADRASSGFTGVEFVRDPQEPRFYQVKCDSWRTRDRYARHRGMVDRSRGPGLKLSQRDLDRAAELVGRG
jgi:hypothetical protein